MLLTRDTFRTRVFERDRYQCVSCGNAGQDAHHIIERRLFPDGGYYLDNGATLCGSCHVAAESTTLEADVIRRKAGITTVVIPPHFYQDTAYDKWGNIILPNGRRLPGELFSDPSVQKILQPVLHLFDNRVKYPRTWHLPWSPSVGPDDRVLDGHVVDSWGETRVVITEKMDGENTTMYHDYIHARSVDYNSHVSRDWVRNLHAQIRYDIPEGMRICGENLACKHSIYYHDLPSYFLVFSIWEGTTCLSWDETVEWCGLLGLTPVRVLYRGLWKTLYQGLNTASNILTINPDAMEGYVVRPEGAFSLRDFSTKVGKYVRRNHVQTHGHWMRSRFEPNGLKR